MKDETTCRRSYFSVQERKKPCLPCNVPVLFSLICSMNFGTIDCCQREMFCGVSVEGISVMKRFAFALFAASVVFKPWKCLLLQQILLKYLS